MSEAVPPPSNTSTSPLPPASQQATPSAFSIGKSFIKQYYEVLATSPDNITRFYKPDSSIISHSFEPSVPADPKTPSTDSIGDLFTWAGSGKSGGICVDFCNGTIDAQETINGGIILVVTGQMTLPANQNDKNGDDNHDDDDKGPSASIPRPFVHTFFLNNSAPAGRKKNFYVHNDVLRFISTPDVQNLVRDQPTSSATSEPQGSTSATSTHEAKDAPQDKPTPTSEQPTLEASTEEVPKAPQPPQSKVQIVDEKLDKVIEEDDKNGEKDAPPSNNDTNHKNKTKADKSKQSKPKSDDKNHKKKDKDSPSTSSSTATSPSESAAKSNKSDKKKNSSSSSTTNHNNTTSSTNEPSSSTSTSDQQQHQPTKDEKKSKKNKQRSRSRKKGSRSSSPSDGGKNGKSGKNDDGSSKQPKTPGSWASLVAGSGSSPKPSPAAAAAASVASQMTESNHKSEESEKPKSTSTNADTSAAAPATEPTSPTNDTQTNSTNTTQPKDSKPPQPSSSSKSNTNSSSSVAQRTPEATLFLKNIPDRTKESEIRSMFEPYATSINQKILGITLKANSGFCFVDFDAKIVVDNILKDVDEMKSKMKQQQQQSKEGSDGSSSKKTDGNKFVLHGKLLDVTRKVPNEKSGGGGRGHSFRSASPGTNTYQKSRHHRRNSPRGGNRSGRHGHQDKKS